MTTGTCERSSRINGASLLALHFGKTVTGVLLACAMFAAGCASGGGSESASLVQRGVGSCPGFDHAPVEGVPVDLGQGSLAEAIETFVSAIKGPDSGNYRPPTSDERVGFAKAWHESVPLPTKRASLDAFGYDLFLYDDTGNDVGATASDRWVVACERHDADGGAGRGWGLYMSNPRGASTVIEVPHPRFDTRSEDIGVAIARKTGGTFLLAGAHRNANGEFDDDACSDNDQCADMSHQDHSIFQAVHDITINPSDCADVPLVCKTGFVVVQPHGFATRLHQGIGNIAISDGTPDPMPPDSIIDALADDLADDRFQVCRFEAPGGCAGTKEDNSPGTSLGATKNVQGLSAQHAVVPVAFVHVEVSREVRDKRSGDLSRRRVGEIVGARLR